MSSKPNKAAPLSASRGHVRRKRDTPENCRAKAKENLVLAMNTLTANERALLERSAAMWSIRAEQLERDQARLAAKLHPLDPEAQRVRL